MTETRIHLRLDDHLARDLKRVAASRGESVNAFATLAVRALVERDSSDPEVRRIRARLAAADLVPEA